MVPISALLPSDSPRLEGEDEEHVRQLAETAGELPPILVRRSTMRVIDGMHRLRAAELKNEDRVPVHFFDGSQQAAFVLSVKLNAAHGLPLSRADKVSAAARIIDAYPEWSDRRIAQATGLGAGSVSAVRLRSTAQTGQLKKRVGRDGRARPLHPAEGRVRASRLIEAKPESTLKEIAEQAGISIATVKDVRDRVRAGKDPLPHSQRAAAPRHVKSGSEVDALDEDKSRGAVSVLSDDLRSAVERMLRDPSMRTDAGRSLLQILRHAVGDEGKWHRLAAGVPKHRAATVAWAAKAYADQLLRFARSIEASHTE
ncbi:ParB N-terminal domain-containing protein [Streptomyces sp. NPDC048483]|uniref:ParB/RepB/Spo0J family partition protein n=1 Tax=Streptomyces sp. NPDC048483 TaxID=3154927 RepID=UPI00342C7982